VLRQHRIDAAFERVIRTMGLRRPQREALDAVRELFAGLDDDLPNLSRERFADQLLDAHPDWSFAESHPHLTFALATGVGKTLLMGAIAAFLGLSGQSRHFLLLAPRTAILRKLEAETRPDSPKYIFVDPGLVPQPRLWHRGNLEGFAAAELLGGSDAGDLFVLSPQSLTGIDRRVARRSEFAEKSVLEYLAGLDDLVVFMDEAHHLGGVSIRDATAWTQAIRDLKPRIQFGMTATPRQDRGVNTLYQYDLPQALEERRYTKDVRLIVRERPAVEDVSDADWDHVTLEMALDRLARKRAAIEDYREGHPDFPAVEPVLLVCAQDTNHADQVAEWLTKSRQIEPDELLVTHTGRSKSEDEIARLVGIDTPGSRVRVVVNVFELTEGWDVTNVYVIAPLRTMGTFQGAVQTMGRGLRLPAGRRVGIVEVDRLDVLCFGRESLQEILEQATTEYGEVHAGLEVVEPDAGDDGDVETHRLTVPVSIPVALEVPVLRRIAVEPPLDFELPVVKELARRGATEFDLHERTTVGTTETLKYDPAAFLRIVTGRVIAQLRYLSDPLHGAKIEALATDLLEALDISSDAPIDLDPFVLAALIVDQIDKNYRREGADYEPTNANQAIAAQPFEAIVPTSVDAARDRKSLAGWTSALTRTPIAGWSRCVHSAARFDTEQEFRVAEILDRTATVQWWWRNDPPQFRLSTPIGFFEPDFIFLAEIAGQPRLVILEVKGGIFWNGPDSDPRVKATAALSWCSALNGSDHGGPAWEFAVVIDTDVEDANSVEDLLAANVAS
jgi:Type III restriction enzyme, res subunit